MMSLPVTFRRQAEKDLDAAVQWYERESAGLGGRFERCVEEVLDRISGSPQIHGRIFGEVRCARVKRFPYGVYYRIEEDRVVVIAVFHSKRDPAIWQRRV